jgi:hypothetical protein
VAGCCENGDEPLGSIKCGEFLDQLSILLASQDNTNVDWMGNQISPLYALCQLLYFASESLYYSFTR